MMYHPGPSSRTESLCPPQLGVLPEDGRQLSAFFEDGPGLKNCCGQGRTFFQKQLISNNCSAWGKEARFPHPTLRQLQKTPQP